MGFWKGSPDFLNLRTGFQRVLGCFAYQPPPNLWCFCTLRGCEKWHPNSHPFGTPKGGSRYICFLNLHIRLAQVPFGAKQKNPSPYILLLPCIILKFTVWGGPWVWDMPDGKLSKPIGSMYGIFTYIYHTHQTNVGKYTIHGMVWVKQILHVHRSQLPKSIPRGSFAKTKRNF